MKSPDPVFPGIISRNKRMLEIFGLMKRIMNLPVTVLVLGENGTGKEMIARALHDSSIRRNRRFVPVNCAALPEQLLESELFGHTKGSFTGAVSERKGLFEEADGGTFFLDEISDLNFRLQTKLLRVLQEGEIKQIGNNRIRRVDIRFISATNKEILEEVHARRFREDLYYRLKVVTLFLPPLRERKEDIPSLVAHFMQKYTRKLGKENVTLSRQCREVFMKYPWPGNVRELENEIYAAVAKALPGETIRPETLSISNSDVPPVFKRNPGATLKVYVDKYTTEVIVENLRDSDWNKTRTAQKLGISRQTLINKIKKLNIQP